MGMSSWTVGKGMIVAMLNKDRLKEVCDWYASVPSDEIDQFSIACCFGSHLVKYLDTASGYMSGANAFAKAIGGNLVHVFLMFRSIGIRNPFGCTDWAIPHDTAMRLLSEIEELPETKGADLEWANLMDANLEGANLEGAKLDGVNLIDANLVGANLEKANLKGADLRWANLERANLIDANLEGAKLRGASLKATLVRGTILEGKE